MNEHNSIVYQVQVFSEIRSELEPFVPIHWRELGCDQQDVPVDLDWERYAELDRNKKLHTVTARKDGKLIGYHVALIDTAPHYRTTLHAFVDLYYLLPEYRKGKIGLGLFQFAEMRLRELGVVKIVTGTKTHLFHGPLFEGLGYKLSDSVFTKIIKD